MAQFDLLELYRKAFGYVAPPYPVGQLNSLNPANLLPFKSLEVLDVALGGQKKEGKVTGSFEKGSMMGAELRMPVKIRIPGEDWFQLPNEPIISLDMRTEVVVTTLNRGGKRFTVKEEINIGDYRISIKGLAYNEKEDDYPDEVREIRRIIEHPGSKEINSYMFQIFNISIITITGLYVPRDAQMPFRAQAYEIAALSDDDFEKGLLNEN